MKIELKLENIVKDMPESKTNMLAQCCVCYRFRTEDKEYIHVSVKELKKYKPYVISHSYCHPCADKARGVEKMNKDDNDDLEYLGIVLGIIILILVIGCIFEIGLLTYAYINADKVECNLLWCTFTSEHIIKSESNFRSITQTSSSECYINNEMVNCSEIDKQIKRWTK